MSTLEFSILIAAGLVLLGADIIARFASCAAWDDTA